MKSDKDEPVIVIGAGVGGLTAAALLLKAGVPVTVLESQVYPGGSAGTFYQRGFRFDSGATLAGGFDEGGPHQRILQYLNIDLPVYHSDPAWIVHLQGHQISQWSKREDWELERLRHFPDSRPFWKKQEQLAHIAWMLTRDHFPYPPGNLADLLMITRKGVPRSFPALPYFFTPLGRIKPKSISPLLKIFLDAQLLISAQTTSAFANALYGSAALDLPRRGVVMPQGGMGAISTSLVDWIRKNGGDVLFRQSVSHLQLLNHKWHVGTRQGRQFIASRVIANLTHAGLQTITSTAAPKMIEQGNLHSKQQGWGAFVLYAGLDMSKGNFPKALHHQVIVEPDKPLGEGNSVFILLSHPQDSTRAPSGHLAVTISTHTRVDPWWRYQEQQQGLYEEKKEQYTAKVLEAAEIALPGFKEAIRLQMSGTPLTFESFIQRPRGYVGGYPQVSLLNVRSSSSGLPGVWLVGDSIFPGQSTAAVTIGAMQVANKVLNSFQPS